MATPEGQQAIIPSYLLAGNTHTTLNNGSESNQSILDAAYDVATKLIPLGIGSGVSQLYNIIPSIGNWAGGNFETNDYAKTVADFDSDLSKYYTEHKLGTDALGFVLSSFVPGMAGVKVLNAGQASLRTAIETGKVGHGPLGRSLGLLAPQRDKFAAAASAELANTGNVFKLTEANTLKALASGFTQNALEGAAFTGFVNATMFASSPVLDERSLGDLTYDVLLGGAIGGVVGGVISGAIATSAIKRGATEAEKALAPFGITEVPRANFIPSDRIIFNINQMESKAKLDPTSTGEALSPRAIAIQKGTIDKLKLDVRSDFQALTGDDTILAQTLFDQTMLGTSTGARNNFLDSLSTSRLGTRSSTENELGKISKKLKEGNTLDSLTPEESALIRDTRVSYVKLKGEGAGTVTDERPAVLGLADNLGPNKSIALHPQGVSVGGKVFKHSETSSQPYNILGATLTDVQSRYAWSKLLPKWEQDPAKLKHLHANDIPLLTKAMDDGLTHIRIIPESGLSDEVFSINGNANIREFIKRQKSSLAQRMVTSETTPLTVEEFADKASSLLGIHFSPVFGHSKGVAEQISGIVQDRFVAGNVITMSASAIKSKSLMANIAELKRLEGHQIFQSLVDASGVVSQNLRSATDSYVTPVMKEVIDLSKRQSPAMWKSANPKQIERRRDTRELFASAFSYLSQNPGALKGMPEFNKLAGHLVRPIPQEVLDSVAKRVTKPSFAEIAAKLDMHEGIIRGTYTEEGLFARASAQKQYDKLAAEAGTRGSQKVANIDELPTYAKIVTKGTRFEGMNPAMIDSMATLRAKASLYDTGVNNASTGVLKEVLPDIPDQVLHTGADSGPGLVSFTRGDPGTLDAATSYVGQRVYNISQTRKTAISDELTPSLVKLGNDTDAAIEWSMLNEKVRAQGQGLVYRDGVLTDGKDIVIPIKNPTVDELVQKHIEINGRNVAELSALRSAEGTQFNRRGDTFYPIPRDLRDTPFFAFVVDDTVTGTGHSSMIYAKSGPELEVLKQRVLAEFPEYKVLSKQESEDYFKSQGKFEYERTINDNYINSDLARKGISSSMLPLTDPQRIVSQTLDWHLGRQTNLVREAVSTRYSRQLSILRAQAEPSIAASKSKFGYTSPAAFAENAVNNPATNAMKQMLNIQKMEEFPFWTTVNKTLDEKFSSLADDTAKLWEKAVHPDQLTEINTALNKHGYKGPLVDDALFEAMNGKIARGVLTGAVAKMNGLISTIALRTDPMNAVNNVIGHAVLYGTEAKSIIGAIQKGSSAGAGELAKLANIRLPGTDDFIFSTQKIIARSFERLRTQPELKAYYKEKGFITNIMDQYDQTLDHIAIRAGDSASDINARIARGMDAARGVGNNLERLTGNRVAEEFNRFLAADFMKQISEVAVKHGVMKEVDTLPYINSFVNRTQGNFLASQRPVLFQGPVGQAIGLFQTYQFNLIQQLLRHVGDGNFRNAASMMGMQGAIFGMSGLPAFNAINTHIVGNAGGNTEHKDLYQAIFSGAGQEAGEWIAYGALSNFLGVFDPSLKTNLYTRGDINPRSLTIVPTDPSKVPIYQATERFFTNMKESLGQLQMGADLWPTVLRSLEHNGISRPLAGMAQVLGGMTSPDGVIRSTNQQGNILMAQDLTMLASLARMAGAKPLDEAMVNDAMYRINTYRSNDAAKRAGLGEAVKTNLLGGSEPSEEELSSFMERYVRSGGKQDEFNSFMSRQYRNATVSQAEQLRGKLTQPYSMHLQTLMGGSDNGNPY